MGLTLLFLKMATLRRHLPFELDGRAADSEGFGQPLDSRSPKVVVASGLRFDQMHGLKRLEWCSKDQICK